MNKLTQKIRHFLRDEEGLTMVEYAVAGSLITLAAAAAFTNLGNAITSAINTIIGKMGGGAGGGAGG
ncbi:MAG: Flp family type IVb pilin [Candidatus Nitrosoglobus sp.]